MFFFSRWAYKFLRKGRKEKVLTSSLNKGANISMDGQLLCNLQQMNFGRQSFW